MKISILENVLKNEPKYRLEQAKRAVFVDLIENWNEATALPVKLRDELNEKCPLEIKAKVFESKDGKTAKAVIGLDDGLKIEIVLMRYESKRITLCVSSQAGCALGCGFCATGKIGFKRNLSVDEIVGQVLFWGRWLKNKSACHSEGDCQQAGDRRISKAVRSFAGAQDDKNTNDDSVCDKVSNIVFMGMGEPFLNYDNVLAAIKILNDQKGFNLGARHFSVSTAGIIEGIEKLAEEELQINLAISLHAPNDKLRSQIMPINKKYPINKILAVIDGYIEKTGRKVMFEYIMIDGVNDSDKQAQELTKLMKKSLYFVNLIPCNPVGGFNPSKQERIEKFKAILKKNGVAVGQRHSFGHDILAACGQLAGKQNQRENF